MDASECSGRQDDTETGRNMKRKDGGKHAFESIRQRRKEGGVWRVKTPIVWMDGRKERSGGIAFPAEVGEEKDKKQEREQSKMCFGCVATKRQTANKKQKKKKN